MHFVHLHGYNYTDIANKMNAKETTHTVYNERIFRTRTILKKSVEVTCTFFLFVETEKFIMIFMWFSQKKKRIENCIILFLNIGKI